MDSFPKTSFFISAIILYNYISAIILYNYTKNQKKKKKKKKKTLIYDGPNGSLFISILLHNSEFRNSELRISEFGIVKYI